MEVYLFLAEGFEETEAVGAIDVLRRGGLNVTSVSISGSYQVTGAHNIPIVADRLFNDTVFSKGKALVLPGGIPGATNLNAHEGLKTLIKQYYAENKTIAAICAAPLVLGGLNLLQGKKATVYPGFEDHLKGATVVSDKIVKDGNIITAKGPGWVFDFALAIVAELKGREKADEAAAGLLLK
ncbi:MAG: DJ-1/PfpI family protein [Candidatus Azobacteroides sp.]|nr:DJ-1/PfpI family protein [Candidatus Azobacteroides sp.]